MNKEQQQMVMEYQELQSKLHGVMMERQQLMMQNGEIDRALKALNDVTGKTYEMIGTILIERDTENIKSDLLERKQMLDLRNDSLEKNERMLKSRLDSLVEKLNNMNKGEN